MLRVGVAFLAGVALIAVLAPQSAEAHASYMHERAKVLAETVANAGASAADKLKRAAQMAAQQAEMALKAQVARAKYDREVEELARAHLAELGITPPQDAEEEDFSFVELMNAVLSRVDLDETVEAEIEGEAEGEADAEAEERVIVEADVVQSDEDEQEEEGEDELDAEEEERYPGPLPPTPPTKRADSKTVAAPSSSPAPSSAPSSSPSSSSASSSPPASSDPTTAAPVAPTPSADSKDTSSVDVSNPTTPPSGSSSDEKTKKRKKPDPNSSYQQQKRLIKNADASPGNTLVDEARDAVAAPDIPKVAPSSLPLKQFIVKSSVQDRHLKQARDSFQWAPLTDGYPWHLKRVPLKEYYTDFQIFGTYGVTDLVPRALAAGVAEQFTGKYHKKWADYPSKGTMGALPNWHTDHLMGLQRMKGVNPSSSFRRAPATWDAFAHAVPKFKGTRQGVEQTIHNYLPNLSLDDAFAKGLIFYWNYAAVDVSQAKDVPKRLAKERQLMPAPIVLYFFAQTGNIEDFVPIVIQTLQDYDETKVVGLYYAPPVSGDRSSTYWSWRWAKFCLAQADFMYHEIGPHLGFTHLVMEIAIVAAYRELPPLHPIHAIIMEHSRKTLQLNKGARDLLVPHVFKELDSPLLITVPTLKNLWAEYNFVDRFVPNDLKLRGIDVTLLKEYDYAKDALAYWNSIRKYTEAILRQVYENDAAVAADQYLAAFVHECVDKIPGWPATITTLDLLIDVMTNLQFVPTVQHSAVNYLQEFWGGFIPMEPSSVHGRHPAPGELIDEKFLLAAMPTKFSVTLHREVLKLLSQPTTEPITTHWGQTYIAKWAQHLPGMSSGPTYTTLMDEFKAQTEAIQTRCAKQADEKAYRVLEGQRVANSILI